MRITSSVWLIISAVMSLVATSCGDHKNSDHETKNHVNKDAWLVTGKLTSSEFSNGEVVALSMDGMRYSTKITSEDNFGIELPGNSTYAIYFLPERNFGKGNALSASEFLDSAVGATTNNHLNQALLYFEDSPNNLRDTLRLPKVILDHTLSLGEIDVKHDHDGSKAFPTTNPANRLDFDADGIADWADVDDQNDGRSDAEQRSELERVNICHFTNKDEGTTQSIPLSHLFNHITHGDVVGDCRTAKRPLTNETDNAVKTPVSAGPEPIEVPKAKDKGHFYPDPLVNADVTIVRTDGEDPEGGDDEKDDKPADDKDEGDEKDGKDDKDDEEKTR